MEESVALTVKLNSPAAVGVPLSNPAEESESPAGNAPTKIEYAYGDVPPLAEMVCEYATPIVAAASKAGAMVIVGGLTVSV